MSVFILLRVIEELPVSTLWMFGVGRVVPAVESAAMVTDGVAVVAAAGHTVHVPGQAQSSQGEGHGGAQLLSSRKSLEVDH